MNNQWDQSNVNTYHSRIKDRVPGYDLLHSLSAILLSRHLFKNEGTILVIGAGGAEELIKMSNALPKATFIAVDSSEEMLKLAMERCKEANMIERVQFIFGTVQDLPDGAEYDAAVCLLLHHFIETIEQKQALLTAISKHLVPKAPFFIASICGELKSETFKRQLLNWTEFATHHLVPHSDINGYIESMGKTNHPRLSKVLKQQLINAEFEEVTTYFKALFVEAMYCRKRAFR